MSLLLALLLAAPGSAAVISRVPTAPVPVLRGPLTAPALSPNLGPTLLAAPLSSLTLAPALAAPQLPAAPVVQAAQIPSVVIDLTQDAPQAAPTTLESLVGFAKSLSGLTFSDPKAALDSFWTGSQARKPEVEAAGPSYLANSRDADFLRLGAITAAAQTSPTGRKVLKAVMALTQKEGKPIQVRFQDLKGNLGEYDYIAKVLYLDRKYADGDPRLGAATMIHELVHVLQHGQGVPSEALEMELEAHVLTLIVLDELGIKPEEESSFSAAAVRELRKSPKAFEEWMAGQLPGKVRLDKGFDEAVESLEYEREELQESIENLEQSYARRPSARTKGRLAKADERLAAVQADLKRLKSPSGRAAYRKLAARAKALMQRHHRSLARRD
ncbi:MAG: hypothetical protein HY926_15540 [Elusimicrobia bacterium]|nr:hypothetical protein [Elusimicrobiota bacterium]